MDQERESTMLLDQENVDTIPSKNTNDATKHLYDDDDDVLETEMAMFRQRSSIGTDILQTLKQKIMRLPRHYKILLLVPLLLMLIHIVRMLNNEHHDVKKKLRTIQTMRVGGNIQVQANSRNAYKSQFHGAGEVNEIRQHAEFLHSIEEKKVEKLRKSHVLNEPDTRNWSLCSNRQPKDGRFWPTIGNGHVATVVHSNTVFMNGLYNGYGTSTHRARIPAFISYNVANFSQPVISEEFCLNMLTGMYYEEYKGDQWSLTINMYAHRRYTRLLVTEYILQTEGQAGIKINFERNKGPPSTDIHLQNGTREYVNSRYVYGSTIQPEAPSVRKTPLHIYYSKYAPDFDIPGSVKNTFKKIYLMAASPFAIEARSAFQQGLEMYKDGTLAISHMKAWQEVWGAGRIDINGNSMLAKSVYSSLYYIFSAMPTKEEMSWPFIGLSPGDLGHGAAKRDYNGHVFWDQDTWMYPPILVLNADLGKILVKSRLRTLDAAYENAEMLGLKGAMYPWESAFEGFNVSPSAETTKYELHVTGDVGFGFQQYLMMTKDTDMLQSGRLKEAIGAIAEFWESRLSYNENQDRYELLSVMPPDEWNWPVNNSVYTNQLVKMCMLLPKYAFSLVKETAPKKYEQIANKMYIIEDNELKYHPEFEGYKQTTAVKQADVVLLGFPLNMPMSEEFRLNDLTFYEKATPGGPAMTWGMFAVGWIEMGHEDKAESLFSRQLLNQQEPFHVWTENASGSGATNFITGQGGFLQSILFGYGGLRMTTDHIEMKCTTIPNTESFVIKNMDYIGNSLDIKCGAAKTEVTLISVGTSLTLKVLSSGEKYELRLGRTVFIPKEKFTIFSDAS